MVEKRIIWVILTELERSYWRFIIERSARVAILHDERAVYGASNNYTTLLDGGCINWSLTAMKIPLIWLFQKDTSISPYCVLENQYSLMIDFLLLFYEAEVIEMYFAIATASFFFHENFLRILREYRQPRTDWNNAIADKKRKNANIIVDLGWGKRRKIEYALKVQNVNTWDRIMLRDCQGGVFSNNVHERSRNPITWRTAGGKGEEVTPGIRTKHYAGTHNGDNRNSWNHGRFCCTERNSIEFRNRCRPVTSRIAAWSRAIVPSTRHRV